MKNNKYYNKTDYTIKNKIFFFIKLRIKLFIEKQEIYS